MILFMFFLLSVERDAEALGFAVQRFAFDAEDLGGAGSVAAAASEHCLDMDGLELFEGEVVADARHGETGGRPVRRLNQQVVDSLSIGKATGVDQCSLHHMLELAHVTGPGVARKSLQNFSVCRRFHIESEIARRGGSGSCSTSGRDVRTAIPQRRYLDLVGCGA